MRTWIKFYTEVLRDPKMHRLTDRQYRTCVNLFLLAGMLDKDGLLGSTEDIAFHLRLGQKAASDDLSTLAEVHVVKLRKGLWYLSNFHKRQARPASDQREAVLERVKRHRKSKINERNETVTPLHDGVTSPDSESDTESDIDVEIDIPPPLPEASVNGAGKMRRKSLSKHVKQALENSGVLPVKITEIEAAGITEATIAGHLADGMEGGLLVYRILNNAKPRSKNMKVGKQCKQCGKYGRHAEGCTMRYVSGASYPVVEE